MQVHASAGGWDETSSNVASHRRGMDDCLTSRSRQLALLLGDSLCGTDMSMVRGIAAYHWPLKSVLAVADT